MKTKKQKGEYFGYSLAIFFESIKERREFEKNIEHALDQTERHGKVNYWGGLSRSQTQDFIKGWFE